MSLQYIRNALFCDLCLNFTLHHSEHEARFQHKCFMPRQRDLPWCFNCYSITMKYCRTYFQGVDGVTLHFTSTLKTQSSCYIILQLTLLQEMGQKRLVYLADPGPGKARGYSINTLFHCNAMKCNA